MLSSFYCRCCIVVVIVVIKRVPITSDNYTSECNSFFQFTAVSRTINNYIKQGGCLLFFHAHIYHFITKNGAKRWNIIGKSLF